LAPTALKDQPALCYPWNITNLILGPISGVEAEQTNKYVYKQDIKLIDEAIGEIDLYERPRE